LTGKAVTLTALALAEKEALYGQDLNLDGRIGSPVLMGSPGSGLFVLDDEISYHAAIVGSSTNRPVLEITGADANVVIGIDPSENTAIMKAQQLYFSALSIGAPRTGTTMGTASINDSAKLTLYGGVPIPGSKYDIPVDKTFVGLTAGHGKGTNGSLSIESAATVDMESNGTYLGVGCGLGVGATSISGAGTELNMLADEFGRIEVGCGDQTMGWLGGKGTLVISDSADVNLVSQESMSIDIGWQKGEGSVALSDAALYIDAAQRTHLGVGTEAGNGTLRLNNSTFLMSSDGYSGINLGNRQGKGNLSVEDSLWEVNANNLNVNVGMSGGVGTIRLDNANVVLNSAPTPSANYDWTGTYVRVGGVGWDGKDSSSIGDALITNGTQFSVVGRHSCISIADGKGSKGKMVVDNGATVLVSSTDANKEYAIEDQDLFASLNVGGTGWESYGGQGWLEISGAGTQFLISSDSPETGAHASINVGSNGEAGVVVVKAGAALRADVQSSNLRMSSHWDSKAKEGSSFLQISGQDSMVDVSYVDAGKDNQALIDISDQGRLNAATINIHLNGILMGNSGLIASNDPAGNSLVLVDGKICVGDQLDLIKRTKTTAFGNLDIDGDVVINQTGRLEFDIGQIADYVNIGGQLDIDGTVTVTSATKLTKGTRYLIATADSIDLSGSKLVTVGTVGTLQLDANSTELYFVVA
jgi:hypothetical protein